MLASSGGVPPSRINCHSTFPNLHSSCSPSSYYSQLNGQYAGNGKDNSIEYYANKYTMQQPSPTHIVRDVAPRGSMKTDPDRSIPSSPAAAAFASSAAPPSVSVSPAHRPSDPTNLAMFQRHMRTQTEYTAVDDGHSKHLGALHIPSLRPSSFRRSSSVDIGTGSNRTSPLHFTHEESVLPATDCNTPSKQQQCMNPNRPLSTRSVSPMQQHPPTTNSRSPASSSSSFQLQVLCSPSSASSSPQTSVRSLRSQSPLSILSPSSTSDSTFNPLSVGASSRARVYQNRLQNSTAAGGGTRSGPPSPFEPFTSNNLIVNTADSCGGFNSPPSMPFSAKESTGGTLLPRLPCSATNSPAVTARRVSIDRGHSNNGSPAQSRFGSKKSMQLDTNCDSSAASSTYPSPLASITPSSSFQQVMQQHKGRSPLASPAPIQNPYSTMYSNLKSPPQSGSTLGSGAKYIPVHHPPRRNSIGGIPSSANSSSPSSRNMSPSLAAVNSTGNNNNIMNSPTQTFRRTVESSGSMSPQVSLRTLGSDMERLASRGIKKPIPNALLNPRSRNADGSQAFRSSPRSSPTSHLSISNSSSPLAPTSSLASRTREFPFVPSLETAVPVPDFEALTLDAVSTAPSGLCTPTKVDVASPCDSPVAAPVTSGSAPILNLLTSTSNRPAAFSLTVQLPRPAIPAAISVPGSIAVTTPKASPSASPSRLRVLPPPIALPIGVQDEESTPITPPTDDEEDEASSAAVAPVERTEEEKKRDAQLDEQLRIAREALVAEGLSTLMPSPSADHEDESVVEPSKTDSDDSGRRDSRLSRLSSQTRRQRSDDADFETALQRDVANAIAHCLPLPTSTNSSVVSTPLPLGFVLPDAPRASFDNYARHANTDLDDCQSPTVHTSPKEMTVHMERISSNQLKRKPSALSVPIASTASTTTSSPLSAVSPAAALSINLDYQDSDDESDSDDNDEDDEEYRMKREGADDAAEFWDAFDRHEIQFIVSQEE